MSDSINNRIEDYIIECDLPYDRVNDSMWIIHDEIENVENIVIHHDGTNVIFRVKVMRLPNKKKEEFMELLLRMNSTTMTHGAYAIDEDNNVIIVDTLESENLDLNEFQASIDSIIMAIAQDYKELIAYIEK